MNIVELKKKLRELKRLEERVRRDALRRKGGKAGASAGSIWDRFFSTKDPDDHTVKYSLHILVEMDHEKRKEVFEEFFYHLYHQRITESGIKFGDLFDPALLSLLGLPPRAGTDDVKKKFRELAMKHHPDRGGSHEEMVRLLATYRGLMSEKE